MMLFLHTAAHNSDDDRNKSERIYSKYGRIMFWRAIKTAKSKEIAEESVHDAFQSIINQKEELLSSKSVNDSIFEALFKQAVIDNFNDELDSVPSDEEIERLYPFSPEHEEKMRKLFANERRKGTRAAVLRRLKQVAAVVCSVFVIGSLLLATSPQIRAAVADTVTDRYRELTRLVSPTTSKNNIASNEPSYIPDGFALQSHDATDSQDTFTYANNVGDTIVLTSSPAQGAIHINNDSITYTAVTVDDTEYHTFTSQVENGENSVVFNSNGQSFTITSTVSIKELLNIAESVPK